PDDLPGKRVGATTGSTAAEFVKAKQAKLTEYQTVDQMVAALEKGELDAVVFDAPVLLYYASHGGAGKVRVVGPVFKKENYGIVFPQGIDVKRRTSLRKKINEALLKMREDGTYDRLYDTWFKIGTAQ
ncbi:MAG: transporter substrate-binding domain-containing protein, partial [Hyphomicrobiales bacterium]